MSVSIEPDRNGCTADPFQRETKSEYWLRKATPLTIALPYAVAIRMHEWVRRGGPDFDDGLIAEILHSTKIAEHGDALLFGDRPGEATKWLNELAEGIAILSFHRGGIRMFGVHYQAWPGDVDRTELSPRELDALPRSEWAYWEA